MRSVSSRAAWGGRGVQRTWVGGELGEGVQRVSNEGSRCVQFCAVQPLVPPFIVLTGHVLCCAVLCRQPNQVWAGSGVHWL